MADRVTDDERFAEFVKGAKHCRKLLRAAERALLDVPMTDNRRLTVQAELATVLEMARAIERTL